MNVTVMGAGYVGLVSAACLAEVGHDVLCMDVDLATVDRLQAGDLPIWEPGLADLVRRNVAARRLRWTSDAERAVRHGVVQLLAVGTPPLADGSVDLTAVWDAARVLGAFMTDYTVIVDKSTVPVGTASAVQERIAAGLAARGRTIPFAVVSNPEFLKEGEAVANFMRPDRIVLGSDDGPAIALMKALYAPFQRNHERFLVMDCRSAELTKYAANAMLATRISLMNELALFAEQVGADIEWVRQGIGSDPRIGYHFLYAGIGYGGSCFPKDVQALIAEAARHGRPMQVLTAVHEANQRQHRIVIDKLASQLPEGLRGRHIAIWGLAFKPNTDDLREAPSAVLIDALLAQGASVCAYDPVAMTQARRVWGERVGMSYADAPMQALEGADALVIVTEWKEFRSPDFQRMRRVLRTPLVIDGRNMYAPELPRAAGLNYVAIGRG